MAKKTAKKTKKKTKKKKATPTALKRKKPVSARKPKSATKAKATPKRVPMNGLLVDVEHLVGMMVANDVTEIDVTDGNRKIALKRGAFGGPALAVPTLAPMAAPLATGIAPAAPEAPIAPPAEEDNLQEIKSPMVGTFYAAASPDTDPFVTPGAYIENGAVVCIIEAMKVMNEIKADHAGVVAEICVKDGDPVEFGAPLFKLKPA